jgi:hypothetical protein
MATKQAKKEEVLPKNVMIVRGRKYDRVTRRFLGRTDEVPPVVEEETQASDLDSIEG